jgi:hypothetical protein
MAFPSRRRPAPAVLAAASVALFLASCADRPAPHRLPAPMPAVNLASGPACLARLDADGVRYRSVAQPDAPHPCGLDTPVSVRSDGDLYTRPVLMGCALADVVDRWETEVVEPAARRDLDLSIKSIVSYGAYACRQEVGSSRNYVSMHSYGLAIDVAGWIMSDGSRVTVARNWAGGGPAGRFLHDVAAGGCRYFSVVLTPKVNAAHHDHFHLDIGPYRYCGSGSEG